LENKKKEFKQCGLPLEEIANLGERLSEFYERFGRYFRTKIKVHAAFQESILVLDESAEEKAGEHSASAGHQHNGRVGKIEESPVRVFLALVAPDVCTWIDGELYLPSAWFEDDHAEERKRQGCRMNLNFRPSPN
jgi:SRSO17 transposase